MYCPLARGLFFCKKNKLSILKVYFDRFQGTYRGETQISGYAESANGARRPFVIATPQRGDGYTAMLDSLNAGLSEVAQIIAR